jgi:hypothetical protein
MPGIVEEWVSRPEALERLDRHINETANPAAFHQRLAARDAPGFGPGGPFHADPETQAHWTTDWIDENGRGGRYWPYATEVDVAALLAGAITASVQRTIETGKIHNTLWISSGEPPAEHLRGEPVPESMQTSLFKVAVVEGERVVNLVIMTPRPV